jgi:hypothetical protein
MALAPRTDQNMPDCLRREPITALHPASMTPEPTNQVLAAKPGVAHALGIPLKVICLDAKLLDDFGIG